ncbi:hypothetical protein HDU67_008070 [Dinochytrium kinnereticum]|nr:hypothetical protein HDU67_008070 [Dinochytrium kinnereticum]
MAALLFIVVYFFSLLRTINPQRFFGASLVGPLLAFLAISSAVGTAGRNTSGGKDLDHRFLEDTIVSMLVGVGISWIINVGLWPDFAEVKLRKQFSDSFETMGFLLSAIVDGYLLQKEKDKHPIEDEAVYEEIRLLRSAHISTLRTSLTGLTATLDAADAEISYSHMTMSDFTHLYESAQSLSGHLFALDTALSDMGTMLMENDGFREQFLSPLAEPLRNLQSGCLIMLDETRREVSGCAEAERGDTGPCNAVVRKAVGEFEEKQFDVLFDLMGVRVGRDARDVQGNPSIGWDSLMQFVDDLIKTHDRIHAIDPQKRFHFHFRHFIPKTIFNLFKSLTKSRHRHPEPSTEHPVSPSETAEKLAQSAGKLPGGDGGERKKRAGLRASVLLPMVRFGLSSGSIYAVKCATAVLILNIILYSQPTFFQNWGLQGSVITFLVAIAPSLGQTYLGFPMQLIATAIGSIWAYVSLVVFGANGTIGLIGFSMILVVPMMYIFLFNKALPVLGLLAMLSFSNSVIISFNNRNQPFDSPVVRLYKNLANVTMGLTFAVIFTLVIYPNLARRSLRALLSSTITLINGHYADLTASILSTTQLPPGSPSSMSMLDLPPETIARFKDTHNAIAVMLAAAEPLMVFSAVEPRVEGPFQMGSYRAVMEGLKRVLDRLGNARAASGSKRFPVSMHWLFTEPKLAKSRAELYQTIRLLLFIYSSTFIAKQRLPHDLPNAFAARKRLVEAFSSVSQTSPADTSKFRSEAWVRFYSYALAVRGISLEIDALAIPIKELFGELPDLTFGSGHPGSYGAEGEDAEDEEVARVVEMNAAFTSLLAMRGADVGEREDGGEARHVEESVFDLSRKDK